MHCLASNHSCKRLQQKTLSCVRVALRRAGRRDEATPVSNDRGRIPSIFLCILHLFTPSAELTLLLMVQVEAFTNDSDSDGSSGTGAKSQTKNHALHTTCCLSLTSLCILYYWPTCFSMRCPVLASVSSYALTTRCPVLTSESLGLPPSPPADSDAESGAKSKAKPHMLRTLCTRNVCFWT